MIHRLFDLAKITCFLLFLTFSLVLCIRCFAGHNVTGPLPIGFPLNAESFVAVSFVLLLLLHSHRGELTTRPVSANWAQVASVSAGLGVLCLAAYGTSLSAPFLFDDYGHVALMSSASWHTIADLFYRRYADTAFRPFTFLVYHLNFQWAGWHPLFWHCWNLGVHLANSVLVWMLARKLGGSTWGALVAGALFAVQGGHGEVVAWADAEFDLLATLFVLLASLCILHYTNEARRRWLWATLVCNILACASKESGFCLPVLLLALSFWLSGEQRRRLLQANLFVFLVTGVMFAYRWWLIGGVGGYKTNGHADILNVSVVRSCKALLWRTWAHLFFPINWVIGSGLGLSLALLGFLLVMGICILRAQVPRRALLGCIALTLGACLPVQHLLLIGGDLAGARYLYLPTIGLSLLWAVVMEGQRKPGNISYWLAGGVLLFHFVALERNLQNWTFVAQTSEQVCRSFGAQIQAVPGKIAVTDLPDKYRGVYFLSHGFPQCVEHNSGVSAERIQVVGSETTLQGTSLIFRWDPQRLAFHETKHP